MKEQKNELRNQMLNAFGTAPDSYKESMRLTLASIEEEPNMKKRHVSVAAAIVAFALLCGTAFAMHRLGALDFLFPSGDVKQEVTEALQTSFVQQGGDLGAVQVHVRDAVSDGIALHAVVAYEVTNPEDVILIEYSTDPDENGNFSRPYPHTGSFDDDVDKWVVYYMEAMVDGKPVLSGVEYRYESPQTLLVQYVIDLSALSLPQANTIEEIVEQRRSGVVTSPLPEEIKVEFTPKVYLLSEGVAKGSTFEPVTVTLKTEPMPQTILRSKQEVEFSGMKTTGVEAILTPLATYVTISYEVILPDDKEARTEASDKWREEYQSLWFDIFDGSGEEIQGMTGGRRWGTDDVWPILETAKQICVALPEIPQELTFVPFSSTTDKRLPPFTVQMEIAEE